MTITYSFPQYIRHIARIYMGGERVGAAQPRGGSSLKAVRVVFSLFTDTQAKTSLNICVDSFIRTQTFIPLTTHIFSPRRTEEAVMK